MWPYPQETADLVTFTEEILNGKLNLLCSDAHTKLMTEEGVKFMSKIMKNLILTHRCHCTKKVSH